MRKALLGLMALVPIIGAIIIAGSIFGWNTVGIVVYITLMSAMILPVIYMILHCLGDWILRKLDA